MASTVNKCTTDMKLLKFINEIYSPYNKAHSAKPHKKIIMHHHKQSNQNSSTKSKEKYTSITSSFQSVQYSITKKMQTYLNKYNSNVEMYNMKVINNIIFEEQRQIVSRLRNILLWDQSSEFLKRFYHIGEIKGRLPQITNYYETYTLFSPVYFGFEKGVVKIMLKYVKRKKKYLEYIEDNEDRKYYNEKEECKEKGDNRRIQCDNNIINPHDIEDGSRCCCCGNDSVNKSGHSMYKEFAYFVNCVGHKGNDIGCGSSNSNMIITNEDNNVSKHSCLFDITNNYGIIKKYNNNASQSKSNNNNNSHNGSLKQTKVIEIKKLNFKNLNFISKKNTTRHKTRSKEPKHTNTNNSKIPRSHPPNTTSTTITTNNNNTNKRKPSFPKDKLLYQPIRKFFLTDRLSLCKHPSSFILPPNSTKHNNNNNKYIPKKQRKHKPQVNLVIPIKKPRKSFTHFHETKASNNNNLKLNLSKPKKPYKPSTTMKIQQPITFLNSSNTTIIQPKHNKHKHKQYHKLKHLHIITSPLQSTSTNITNNISHHHTSSTNKKHKSPPYDNITSSTHKTHKTTNSLKTTTTSSKPIPSNNSHSTSTSIYTTHFKTNLCTLKLYTKTKDKISYDFNTNNCSRSITQKRLSNNKTKKVSRNENPKNKIAISLLHTTHNKCRHLVLPVSKDKPKKKIHHHDKSITLGLIKHEKTKQSHIKRYPLTSRNEKESITIELINKLLIIRNK